jgi:hypothetical protein
LVSAVSLSICAESGSARFGRKRNARLVAITHLQSLMDTYPGHR